MAKITAEEYAKVKQATSKYTDEQKQQVVDAYKSGGVSAAKNAIANQRTPSTPVETPKQETTPTTPTPQETPTTTPTAPTSTPTTPKANETVVSTDTNIKQEGALKPLSQEYYNQTSQEAQDKIVANLNGYRQTNPEYFSSYEDFKKNFSYDSRNEQQKNTLDQWYKGYTKGMELSGLPVTDLYTQWKDGTVSNSDLENLRISNPGKYAELQNTINKGNIIAAYNDDTGGTETGMSIQDMAYQMMVQTFNQYMNGDSSSGASQFFRDYEAKMNDPEMLGLSDQCTEIQENMENIQSDLDAIKKTVEAEYEGTGASRAKINAIISDRSYDLQLQLRTLNSEYNKYATQYNNRMNQYQNEFNLQLQEYQLQQNERQMQMKELGFAMDLMSFETPEQAQERQWNYWVKQQEYTNGNINSKDYQTRYKAALKSVENLLSQYEGIPMIRSAEQMAQDVLKAIDNGSDLGTELTKINQQIQQKPEYKYLYNNTFNPTTTSTTSTSLIQDSMKIGDTEWVKYNDKRYTADEFNKFLAGQGMTQGTAKPYDLVDESVFSTSIAPHYINDKGDLESTGKNLGKFLMRKLNGQEGGQCGKYVNDYLQFIGMTGAANRYYDNELSTKLNSINSYNPKVGTIAVFDYNHKSSDGINHGHVGIVTKVYADGSFDVRDSNYSGDEKIKTRHISGDEALRGFFDPSKPPMNTETGSTTTQTANDAFTAAGNNIALNLGSVSATNTFNEQLSKYLEDGDYTRAFEYITTQARNKADSDTKAAINSAESAIGALVSIQKGLDAFYEAGGDTNIFAGTAEQVTNKIGKTTDPELKKLATQINVAIQKYRQAISGAAFSEQEAAEYASIFPSTKNDKELNTALIDGTLQTMLQNLTSSYAQILGTSTYTDLLKAYQDSTGDIYDYYGGKEKLSTYLLNNGYLNTNNSTTQKQATTQSNTITKTDMNNAIRALNLKYGLK